MDQAAMEMPRYECHKQVWALKIKAVRQNDGVSNFEGGSWLLDVEEPGFAPIEVSHRDYVLKHSPYAGGYYVVYADGYKSFSPGDVFEDGYTRAEGKRLESHQERVVAEKAELDDRLGKLSTFIDGNSVFDALPIDEKYRLTMQRSVMNAYSSVLAMRIAAFNK